MDAGRELDLLIAEKVLKIIPSLEEAKTQKEYENRRNISVPSYSTDISDAWEVVKKLAEDDRSFQINFDESDREVRVHFKSQSELEYGYHAEKGGLKYLPHAICLAALKAIGHIKI